MDPKDPTVQPSSGRQDRRQKNPPGERTLVRCTGDTGCCLSGKIASGKYTNLLVNYVSLVANELIVADTNDAALSIGPEPPPFAALAVSYSPVRSSTTHSCGCLRVLVCLLMATILDVQYLGSELAEKSAL